MSASFNTTNKLSGKDIGDSDCSEDYDNDIHFQENYHEIVWNQQIQLKIEEEAKEEADAAEAAAAKKEAAKDEATVGEAQDDLEGSKNVEPSQAFTN